LALEDEYHAEEQPSDIKLRNKFYDDRRKAVRWCKESFKFSDAAKIKMTKEVLDYVGPTVADVILAPDTNIHPRTGVMSDIEEDAPVAVIELT
jgi:hypothetical protein